MVLNWIGDDDIEAIARIEKFTLRAWRSSEDGYAWTLGLENGPVAKGYADTLTEAKKSAEGALEDYRSGALQ